MIYLLSLVAEAAGLVGAGGPCEADDGRLLPVLPAPDALHEPHHVQTASSSIALTRMCMSGSTVGFCWDRPLRSTVGSCWDRLSAFAGIDRKL
jgi:hypothetical protein